MPKLPKAPSDCPPDLKFEEALAELEALVQRMEGGQLELEASIDAYKRGTSLLQHCQGLLANAEQKIQIMEAGQPRDWQPEGDTP